LARQTISGRRDVDQPYGIEPRCFVDDSNDLDPWLYTAMLTGRGGELGDARAFAVEHLAWFVSNDPDDLSPRNIKSENARVREWMDRHPDGVKYCFELDAIHEDLDWLLFEWDTDVGVRYNNRPDLMRKAVVYHVHNYHYRVHAYRDKVAQLLNACLDLGRSERKVNAADVLKAIARNPEHRTIHDLLCGLINDERVKDIVDRRNAIAHRALLVYKSGKDKWQVVTAEGRAQEYFDIGGLSQETQLFSDLAGFHRHESQTLRDVTSFLKGFRYDLTRSLRQLALTQ